MNKKSKKGYIQVYTGTGKGKTTAAMGLALRSWGQGFSVCIIQFMKKSLNSGEYKASLKLGKRFVIKQFGRNQFIRCNPTLKDKELARDGLNFAKEIIKSSEYDVIILDEVNCALKLGLVKSSEVKELLKIKPLDIELVFTGRDAPEWLLKKAHLVTDMKEKKHYFRNKVTARCGIEY